MQHEIAGRRILGSHSVLLLSGGVDSAALAALLRPAHCLSIDYGQRPAMSEKSAAQAVAAALGLPFATLAVDCRAVGAGLLADEGSVSRVEAPTEWWPFRNQLLITLAAAWALRHTQADTVVLAAVAGDGDRHRDGSAEFFTALDNALTLQEGQMHVVAPASSLSSNDLISLAGVGLDILGWTHSCHRSDTPCGHCPGCAKRSAVLTASFPEVGEI